MAAEYSKHGSAFGMSFPFKTGVKRERTIDAMDTSRPPHCPFHAAANDTPSAPSRHPPGVWPPGPASGLTGWGLLRRLARDPLGALSDWRERHGDMVHLRIWPEHQIVVSAPHLARELLVDNQDALIRWERGIDVFSRLHGQSVLTTEGEAWRIKRQALQPQFSPKCAKASVAAIAGTAAAALSAWPRDAARMPIESALNALAMDVIVRTTLSSAQDDDARLVQKAVHDTAVAGNAEMYWPASWPDSMPWKRNKRQAIRMLQGFIARHIQARLRLTAAQWPQDLLSRLLTLHREDPAHWPLQAVHDECMTTFLAGHETAAATLTWWAWCMAANPQVQQAARQEVHAMLQDRAPGAHEVQSLSYLNATLQETLRLYPAAPLLLSRRSIRPITLGPWQFPARTMFSVPVFLMHHDARWFPDPLAFRPERFGSGAAHIPRGAFMPFGAGPRVCLGQNLALTQMTVIAAMMLQRFKLEVPAGMAAPAPAFHITLRPRRPLELKLSGAGCGAQEKPV